jgi:hypothetical protein
MKKLIILTAGLAILAFGCASSSTKTTDIVDTIRPGANEAIVYFIDMEIEGYDVTADEKGLPYAKITAGETTFRGRVIIIHSQVAFLAANVEFALLLEQGKIYLLVGTAQYMMWGISVYENVYNPRDKETNKIAFIPFINQPTLQTLQ